jgi:hypothetical protein
MVFPLRTASDNSADGTGGQRPAPASTRVPLRSTLVTKRYSLNGEDEMQMPAADGDPYSFERSLPYKFRSFLIELGAAVTPGGNGIVIYRGFKAIATLSRADAENLS